MAADARDALIVRRAAVDGAELAEHVLIADLKVRALAPILLILRIAADGGELEDAVSGADARRPIDHRMRAHARARTNDDIRVDDREWAHRDIGRELSLRRDDRVRIDARTLSQVNGCLRAGAAYHLLASGATIISACATSSVPTSATVEKRQMPLKLRSSCALSSS